MKGLILCAGRGTRLRPFTHSLPKPLIPVANKPIVCYGIEALKAAGISDIGIVVGERKKDIMNTLGNGSKWGMSFTYIVQDHPRGIAHAVKQAEQFLQNQPFILYLGDNIFQEPIKPIKDYFVSLDLDGLLVLKNVADPQQFGVAEVKGTSVIKVWEKPSNPPTNLAITGLYLFSSKIFQEISQLSPSARGELEITDAIRGLIDRGGRVKYKILTGWWRDTGNAEEILNTNRSLLETIEAKNEGTVDNLSHITGTVEIGKGSKIINSKLIGPVLLDEGCRVENSIIGPYTSLGRQVYVSHCTVEGSLVMDNTRLEGGNSTFRDSILGRNVFIKKGVHAPVMKFMIGDDNELIFRK